MSAPVPERPKHAYKNKFVIRMSEDFYGAVLSLSRMHYRSVNSEFCIALDQWMNHRERAEFIASVFARRYKGGANRLLAINPIRSYRELRGDRELVVRLDDELRTSLGDYVEGVNAKGEKYTNHRAVLEIMAWWVKLNLDIEAVYVEHVENERVVAV